MAFVESASSTSNLHLIQANSHTKVISRRIHKVIFIEHVKRLLNQKCAKISHLKRSPCCLVTIMRFDKSETRLQMQAITRELWAKIGVKTAKKTPLYYLALGV